MDYILTPEEWTAAGTIANIVIVAVLAIINYLYLRSAKTQADATVAQADAARDSLRLLKIQMYEKEKDELQRAITIIRSIMYTLNFWKSFFPNKWGSMPDTMPPLLPPDWFFVFQLVSRISPNLREDAQGSEQVLGNAEYQLKQFLSRPANYRDQALIPDVERNLEDATPRLNKLLTALEAHERRLERTNH